MRIGMLLSSLPRRFQQYFQPTLPPVACEISSSFVSVVRLNAKRPPAIDRFAVEPVSPGLISPSLTRPIVTSASDLLSLLKSAFAKADLKTSRISLAIPDSCAKVTIHQFDSLPGSESEREQLLKWKLKKTLPFNVEDSHLSFLEQKTHDGKHVVVTANIHLAVLAQLEAVFESLGMQVGYITLASFAAFEVLARQDPEVLLKSVLFVRAHASEVSSLIVRQGSVVFFRHTNHDTENSSELENAFTKAREGGLEQLYEEIHPCLMYYQDKLSNSAIEKVYIANKHSLDPDLLSSLSQRSNTPVFSVDPLRLFQRMSTGQLENLKSILCPSLGLALGRF
jgi:Tfp pilus assembly PilM family ATPase